MSGHGWLHRLTFVAVVLAAGGAVAQTAAPAKPAKAPDALMLYFATGSADIRPQDTAILDQASRLYRDGNPLVMIVSGSADLTGNADFNLRLSEERANNVVKELVARGIPAARFQILAKGETAPVVPTAPGVAEQRNRCVEITWR